MKLLIFSLCTSILVSAVTLQESDFFNYDVFFTNPICKEYKYNEAVYAISGDQIDSKPKNVYCKRGDFKSNENRDSSPHYNLKKLISDKEIDELFLTYLSFSNSDIAESICKAIERNVKVTFIIDSKNRTRPGSTDKLDYISKCKPKNVLAGESKNYPITLFRGNTNGLGYAHNKLIIGHYKNSKKVKIIYGSANMSSGTILHHENWHFITTSKETYFYESHLCLRDGMIKAGESKSEYVKFIKECRNKIKFQKETDISFFIVPSDGKEAISTIQSYFKKAQAIDVAVHRFTHPAIINGMKSAASRGKNVRMIADDDIYWSGILDETVGSNMFFEYKNVIKVVRGGVKVKYMETNQNSNLLHHNKYIIFSNNNGDEAVHAGAGNFTQAAFSKNFENFYFIKIPSVIEKFKTQYKYIYENLATNYYDMPVQYVMP